MKYLTFHWPENVPLDQHDYQFIQGMLDRMAQGFFTYGHARRVQDRPNNLRNLELRVDKYINTGNTEFLMDASNFLMMEFMVPSVSGAHFKSTGPEDSPGSVVAGRLIKHKDELPPRGPSRREGD